MKIDIINTMTINDDPEVLIRLIDIDGVRHLQMQGRDHETMCGAWDKGLLMTCPESLTLEEVANDHVRYSNGYGEGCDIVLNDDIISAAAEA